MHYLDNTSFIKSKSNNIVTYAHESLEHEQASAVKEAMCESVIKKEQNKDFKLIKTPTKSYIIKNNHLGHRNKMIRAAVGIKRNGTYEYSIAEIDNQIKLIDLDYVPRIVGYAFKSKLGLVKSSSICIEYLTDTYNIKEYIEKYPNKIEPALIKCFNLIEKHLKDDIIHLDLWIGNILVNKDLSKIWMIDLEFLQHSPTGSHEKKLGFCLGFMYQGTLLNYITYEKYKAMIRDWLNNLNYDNSKVMEQLEFRSKTEIHRKELYSYF